MPSDILKSVILSQNGNFKVPCRISYPSVFRPRKNQNGAEKYSVACLIPPTVDISALKTAAAAKCKEKFGDKIKGIKPPFLNPVEKNYDEDTFKGWTLIRCSSDSKPGVVGPNAKTVEEPSEAYPGRWALVSMNPYAYDNSGNKGVTFGLNNIQLLDHDEPLAAVRISAEDEFEAVAGFIPSTSSGGAADDVFA
jgi:hypothetical protein